MGYLGGRPRERLDPRRVLPGAASVVAVALNYYQGEAADPSWAPVARYAWGRDYHDLIAAPARAASAPISKKRVARGAGQTSTRAPVLERDLAAQGGPRLDRQEHDVAAAGPRVVVLHRRAADHRRNRRDAPLPDRCGSCRACFLMPAPPRLSWRRTCARCPPVHLVSHHRAPRRDRSRARVADGRVAVRLRSLPERLPVEPQGAGDGRGGVRPSAPYPGAGAVLEMTDDELRRRFAGTPLLRPKPAGLRRDAAIALADVRARLSPRGAGGGAGGRTKGEMNEDRHGTKSGAPPIDALLDRMTLTPYGMPVRLMEPVLERGSAVTARARGGTGSLAGRRGARRALARRAPRGYRGAGRRGPAHSTASPHRSRDPRRGGGGGAREDRRAPPCPPSESSRGRASRRIASSPMPGSAGSRTIPRTQDSPRGSPATGTWPTFSPAHSPITPARRRCRPCSPCTRSAIHGSARTWRTRYALSHHRRAPERLPPGTGAFDTAGGPTSTTNRSRVAGGRRLLRQAEDVRTDLAEAPLLFPSTRSSPRTRVTSSPRRSSAMTVAAWWSGPWGCRCARTRRWPLRSTSSLS